jgi:hypothetical protein
MAGFEISQPRPDVVRVEFNDAWDADQESEAMFAAVVAALSEKDDPVTVLVVAGKDRPVYTRDGVKAARDVLLHDNLGKMVIVADNPDPAVTHMTHFRSERGMPRLQIVGGTSEDDISGEL